MRARRSLPTDPMSDVAMHSSTGWPPPGGKKVRRTCGSAATAGNGTESERYGSKVTLTRSHVGQVTVDCGKEQAE